MIKIHNLAALLALSSVAALAACGGNSQTSRTAYVAPQSPALSQNMIEQVQTRLQQAGTYNGRIDGVWGPGTEAAVRGYQQQHNLNATGQLDGDTLASLNLGGAPKTYGNVKPGGTMPPNDQRYGSNDAPPVNTIAPPGATQPNPATPR